MTNLQRVNAPKKCPNTRCHGSTPETSNVASSKVPLSTNWNRLYLDPLQNYASHNPMKLKHGLATAAAGGAAVTARTTRTTPTPTKTATQYKGKQWRFGIFDCKVIVCELYLRPFNDLSYNCICTTNQLIIHNFTENTSFYLISFFCLFDFESNQWIRFAFLWKQTWNWISNDSDSSNVKPRPWNQATDFLHQFSHYQEDLLLLNCEDGIVNLDR